jgi:hypothetical protein
MGLMMLGRHTYNRVLVTEPSPSEVEIPIEKQKWHQLPGTHKILAQLIQAQDKTLRS